jgi:hypothetical protein
MWVRGTSITTKKESCSFGSVSSSRTPGHTNQNQVPICSCGKLTWGTTFSRDPTFLIGHSPQCTKRRTHMWRGGFHTHVSSSAHCMMWGEVWTNCFTWGGGEDIADCASGCLWWFSFCNHSQNIDVGNVDSSQFAACLIYPDRLLLIVYEPEFVSMSQYLSVWADIEEFK